MWKTPIASLNFTCVSVLVQKMQTKLGLLKKAAMNLKKAANSKVIKMQEEPYENNIKTTKNC